MLIIVNQIQYEKIVKELELMVDEQNLTTVADLFMGYSMGTSIEIDGLIHMTVNYYTGLSIKRVLGTILVDENQKARIEYYENKQLYTSILLKMTASI